MTEREAGPPGLVLGLLDTRARVGDDELADRLRDLTLSWSRFKYTGEVVEGAGVDAVLARAVAAGHRLCLVQAYGHLLAELWRPGEEPFPDFLSGLARWLPGRALLAAGHLLTDGGRAVGLSDRCLLVDLLHYDRLGSPPFAADPSMPPGAEWIRRAREHALDVLPFPPELVRRTVDLHPPGTQASVLRPLLAGGEDDAHAPGDETAPAGFLAARWHQVERLRRGVFVWNLEGYEDVRAPVEGFSPPLRALYSVAAGLKPNFMLHALGADEATRVVFFDYSRPGLEFRRILKAEWDGEDYPRFVRYLFRRLPPEEAHYCLWDGALPDTVSWSDVEDRWRHELAAWGGEEVVKEHWRLYRRLRHAYVPCDVVGDPRPLLAEVQDEEAAVWWSNAFFSLSTNLRHLASERRGRYRAFIEGLAGRAARLLLYGASSDNVAVNGVRAGAYRDWFRAHAGDELRPGRLHAVSLRF